MKPLFQEWHRFLPTKLSEAMLTNVLANQVRWNEIVKEETEKTKVEIQEEVVCDDDEEEEEEIYNNSDEENDIVQETRLPLTFTHLLDDEECSSSSYGGSRRGSCRSLSPLCEIPENQWNPEIRRHSMPPAYLQKDITCVTIRRDSLPHTQYIRRRSLPTAMILHTTSMDRLIGKLSPFPFTDRIIDKSLSIDSLLTQPKISNLSPSFEASRLFSGLSLSSEIVSHKASKYNKNLLNVTNVSGRAASNRGYKGSTMDNTSQTFHSPKAFHGVELTQGETTGTPPVSFNCVGAMSSSDQDDSSVSNTEGGGKPLNCLPEYNKKTLAFDRVNVSSNVEALNSKDLSKHIPSTVS